VYGAGLLNEVVQVPSDEAIETSRAVALKEVSLLYSTLHDL
jgi:hypothetical protein